MSIKRLIEEKQALVDSIEHWKRMLVKPLSKKDQPYAQHCALCKHFNGPYYCTSGNTGRTCPVRKKTGLRGCNGSPYYPASLAWEKLNKAKKTEMNFKMWEDWKEKAEAEIKFLESLRCID